ncbi:hypothetical protein [Nocardia wallacei]|uniref:hypothetical protein n=1 Tax=Nocardia wallacei TaxID=480035 RepID=UPI002455AFB1|nr:hypothetical protein [Nocardia wallacei]
MAVIGDVRPGARLAIVRLLWGVYSPPGRGSDALPTRGALAVGSVGFVKFFEQWRLLIIGDGGVGDLVHIEAFVKGLVEQAADGVAAFGVYPLGVGQQVEAVAEDGGTDGELFAGVGEAELDPVFLKAQVAEFGADLVAGQGAVSERIHKPVLLEVEIAQPPAEAGMKFFGGTLLVGQGFIEAGTNVVDEGGGQFERVVVLDHGILDGFDT